jgi:uncharacterized membrane protein YfhO
LRQQFGGRVVEVLSVWLDRWKNNRNPYPVLLFLVCLLSLIIYAPYIFGNKLYIYSDIGSDTLTSFVPAYQSTLSSLSKGELPFWSFSHGLGANTFPLSTSQVYDPFNALLYLFGKNFIYALPYIQVLKILSTAAMSCALLLKLGHEYLTCLIIPILYAFNADVIVRGGWYHHAIDTFIISLMFFGVECLIQDKNVKVIPLAGMYLVIARAMSYPYIYTIFLVGYTTFRIMFENAFKIKEILTTVFKTIALFFLGIGMGCFFYFPCLMMVFSSSRTNGIKMALSKYLFTTTNFKTICTAILTMFSSAMLGTGNEFLGTTNILEAPILYSGIIMVYLLVLAVTGFRKRQRNLFIALISLCVLYIVWPFMHRIMNGPTDMTYKTSSFMIQNVLLFVAAYGADHLFRLHRDRLDAPTSYAGGRLVRHAISYNIPTGLLLLLAVPSFLIYDMINPAVFIATLVIIILYQVSIIINPRILGGVLLVIISIEVTLFSFLTVNFERQTLAKNSVSSKEYFWDGTTNAVDYINSLSNDNDFFRIQKTYDSFRTCDYSQYQGYKGVYLYSSTVDQSILNFYNAFDPDAIGNRSVIIPSYSNYPLNSILSVQYFLDKGDTLSIDTAATQHLRYLHTIDGIDIYENLHSIPFGTLYNRYIPSYELGDFDNSQKATLLNYAFVPDESMDVSNYVKLDTISEMKLIHEFDSFVQFISQSNDTMKYKSTTSDPQIHFFVQGDSLLSSLQFSFTGTASLKDEGQIFWSKEGEGFSELNSTKFPIQEGTTEYQITIDANDSITNMRLDFGTKKGLEYSVSNLELTGYPLFETELVSNEISRHKTHHLRIQYLSDKEITGTIAVDQPSLLLLSIPHDEGWTAYVGGQQVPIYEVNQGLSGIQLSAGEVLVELRYIPPGLRVGILISIISGCIYVSLCILQRRKNSNGRKMHL